MCVCLGMILVCILLVVCCAVLYLSLNVCILWPYTDTFCENLIVCVIMACQSTDGPTDQNYGQKKTRGKINITNTNTYTHTLLRIEIEKNEEKRYTTK